MKSSILLDAVGRNPSSPDARPYDEILIKNAPNRTLFEWTKYFDKVKEGAKHMKHMDQM